MRSAKKRVLIGVLSFLLVTACSGNTRRDNSGFPEITLPYHSEDAVRNGDVVIKHGDYLNLEKWERFLENVNENKDDKVRIMQYPIDSGPILFELVYNGENIHYTYIYSLDAYGANNEMPSTTCKGIGLAQNEGGLEYYSLMDCEKDTGDTFWLPKAKMGCPKIRSTYLIQLKTLTDIRVR